MGNSLISGDTRPHFIIFRNYSGHNRKFVFDFCICGNTKHEESKKCIKCALKVNGERVGKSNKGIPKITKSLLIGEGYFGLAFIFGLLFTGAL